ncbi:transcription factor, putative [Ricinus communis]|uniref:Transcription factor, putative n=1 Tax=Ricinus communis TaxID=3988 RepID=B9S3X2_RICCO|nr:transcription factor, putative [Ricinus communis]
MRKQDMGKDKVTCEVEGSSKSNDIHVQNGINDVALPPNDYHDDLYKELWRACAGPLVYVPRAGEKVVYYPQGHMEQVEAYMNQDGKMEMPVYNLPSKIFCKVINVQLKAEAGTDEVFAQITLLPETKQDVLSLKEDGNSLPLPRKADLRSFSKKLTSSDTSTHGGFSVLKRHAEECLPPMDMSGEPPEQMLVAKDMHGENGELRIGLRRAMKLHSNASTSVISAHSMQHGILSMAFHAITTGSIFTVYYRPWTNPTEFIIPFDQYVESAELEYSVGTTFGMLFEVEECAEQRSEGTIVGNEDVDHIRWPNSEWRSLKAKWDATSEGFVHPDRVSPWMIVPIEPIKKYDSPLHPSKKARASDASLTGLPSTVRDGALKPPILPWLIPENPESNNKMFGLGNQLCFSAHGPFHPCPSGTILFSGGNITRLSLPNGCSPPLISNGIPENAIGSRNLTVLNVKSCNSGSQDWRTLELKDAHAPPNGGGRYMLFGVDLVKSLPELPSPQAATYSDHESLYSVLPISQSSVAEPSKCTSATNSGSQCKNCCSFTNLSCTKVLKHGSAGRSVDITKFDGYDKLIRELDQMFDFKGTLIDGSSGWEVTYDDEGDIMLEIPAGGPKDVYPPKGIGKLNPSSPN